MTVSVLHLGSNKGDKQNNITRAVDLIEEKIGRVLEVSKRYETEPWGFLEQENFVNAALKVSTELSPFSLLRSCKSIEVEMGRQKIVNWGPRLIDIDIIFYDDLHLESPVLTIPHRLYQYRNFVLQPLADLGFGEGK